MKLTSRTAAVTAITALGLGVATPAIASPDWWPGHGHQPTASSSTPRSDAVTVDGGATSVVSPLANEPKGLQIVSSTKAKHGTVTQQSNGTFLYTPDKGFHGTDSFTYSTSDGVSLYSTDVAPLGTVTGVNISGGAYGSSVTLKPGSDSVFYGLTDRGPNVDGPNGTKVEPLPSFDPAIGEFTLGADGQAVLLKTIPLRAKDGSPMNGLENTVADAGETITDMSGNVLPKSPNGLDSEGLVAARDGTFWVSDEYGPFIVHFDRTGKEISRLSPYDGTLPAELKFREPNKGMEGLTITPDGRTLVGIMQAALTIDSSHQAKSKNIPFTRIVTYDLKTHAVHEYAYVLDDPATTGTAVSEITAVSSTKFLVDERDGSFEPGADKKVYEIDLSKATDIGPSAHVAGARYDATYGLEVPGVGAGGASGPLEFLFTDKSQSPDGQSILQANHVTPVTKSLYLDLGGLVSRLDPTGGFFGHDKVEGIDLFDGGTKLLVSNDSDFGIDGLAGSDGAASTDVTPPFTLHSKTLPNGQQDDGAYLVVDLAKAKDPVRTATVTVHVR
jgi:hypothetical protein